MESKTFRITNSYFSKIPGIEKPVYSLEGINALHFDVKSSTVTVNYDEGRYQEGDIAKIFSQCGIDVDIEK